MGLLPVCHTASTVMELGVMGSDSNLKVVLLKVVNQME